MKTFKEMNINPNDKEDIQASKCSCDCGQSPCIECGKDHHMKEGTVNELSPSAMASRKRMRARMSMLSKKYGDARRAGIHPSRVSQRHNKMTVKKR